MYRIVQEMLTNVAKHASASKVTIQVLVREKVLAVIVADNGKGLDIQHSPANESHGLRNMRERTEFLGGTLRVESGPGHGTELLVEIPLAKDNREGGSGDRPLRPKLA